MITIHTDGGARGNPGPAAIGVVIEWGPGDHQELFRTIGNTTNNVAEYEALTTALTVVRDRIAQRQETAAESIHCFLDSELVVQQVRGVYKVKQPHLRDYLMKIRTLEQEIGRPILYTAIRREHNQRADWLVNHALDTAA